MKGMLFELHFIPRSLIYTYYPVYVKLTKYFSRIIAFINFNFSSQKTMEFQNNTLTLFTKQKPKFIRRIISVNASDENILQKTRQKGVYVKAVSDLDMKSEYLEQVNLKKHKYLKGKFVSCLKRVLIKNSGKYEWYNVLKNAKNIERFDLIFVESEIKGDFLSRRINRKCLFKLLKWIKKLPKGIKAMTMRIDEIDILEGHLQKIYRVLSLFHHLESFKRVFGFTSSIDSYVQQEMELIERYLSKPKLSIGYNFRRNISHLAHDQYEFLEAMKAGLECKWMKDLKLQIEPDSLERADFEDEKSIYSNNEDDYEDDEVKRLKEEMSVFYRFSLFPNLQKLTLELCNRYLCPLDEFVVEGFRALRNLKKLILTINDRPKGTKYFFEGLLEIPSQLSLISLKIPFIKKGEWSLLERVFERQGGLKTINLDISGFRRTKRGYLEENKCFEEYLGRFLSKKPKLQYLYLRSKILTIETLSESLKNVKEFQGQLRLFSVGLFDDNMTTKKTPFERTQGLCDFIKSQKDSLRDLYIEIPFILDVEMMRYLTP